MRKKTEASRSRSARRAGAGAADKTPRPAGRRIFKSGIRPGLSLSLEQALRRDLVLLNNPVLAQGLALTPVVAAATSARNALVLSVMGLLLITPVRVLGELLTRRTPGRMRVMIYALISGAVYIPALLVTNAIFGAGAIGAGIYLPVMVVDGIVLVRAEINASEGGAQSLRNGLATSLGLALTLLLCGGVRELLGDGKLLGGMVFSSAPLPIMTTAAGGFITAALFAALLQWLGAAYLRARTGGEAGE